MPRLPLRDGDRLTRDEFLRRWDAMPDLKFAELLGGVVFMPPPLSLAYGDFHAIIAALLGFYGAQTPGCRPVSAATWLMGTDDVPQPGISLRILPEYGGQSGVKGQLAAGAPELIVEVAVSSRARDLGPKLKLYQSSGVREYVTVLVRQQKVVWRELAGSSYRTIAAEADGTHRSRCFPGLWLDTGALWKLDTAAVLAHLQQGLATPEHRQFVHALAARRAVIA